VTVTDMTAAKAHAAVKRGAAWLDKNCPDWIDHVDLEQLQLSRADHCLLGQTAACLLGDLPTRTYARTYMGVLKKFGQNRSRWAERKGFLSFLVSTGPLSTGWVTFEMLTIAWKELIRERLETQAQP
jgi:hypothetical protein